MALTYSPENPELGSNCPPFKLPAVDGSIFGLDSCRDHKALVVMFICNHCPYVKAIEDRLVELASQYNQSKKGEVQFVGICSNDPTNYPDDSLPNLKKRWLEKAYGFPYLVDETQSTAKAFGAVATPDFFIYDQNRRLTYRGRLDDSWKDPALVKSRDMKAAIDRILHNQPPLEKQVPSMGCSIKWKN